MSFWKNLFGGGGSSAEAAPPPGEEYKGFTIRATPIPMGGEFQLSGVIEKTVNGELKSHKFVRADRMSSRDDAISFALDRFSDLIDSGGNPDFSAIARSCDSISAFAGSSPSSPPSSSAGTLRFERWLPSS